MGGPAPKPVELHLQNGNPGKRPLPEPLLVAGRPELQELLDPPADLEEDAKDFWRESVVKLAEVGILDRVDVPSLEILATAWARVLMCRRVVKERGLFSYGHSGQIKEAPWVKLERESMLTFMRYADLFALTPVARTRLGLQTIKGLQLQKEMANALDGPEGQPVVDAEVVDDDGDIGLPGL